MTFRVKSRCVALLVLLVSALIFSAFSDDALKKLIEDRKFDAAIKHGETMPAEGRSADVWFMLGIAYDNARSDAETRNKAKNAFENALKLNPSHPGVFLAYADFEFKGGNFQAAEGYYQRSFLLERSARAAEGIAKAAMKLKDRERARDAAESAIDMSPDALEPRVILAEILFDAKSYASAAPHLEFVAGKKAKDIENWKKLVVCYENTKESDKLAAADAKIIELDAKDVKSRQRHADYLMVKGDAKGALAICKELVLLTPNDPKPLKVLYEASLKDGNKKDGTMYLRNFVALDSSDAAAIKQLGDLLYEARDMDGALNEYRKAVRRNANITGLYKNYVTILIDKKLDDEALKAIQRAIVLKEVDAVIYTAAGDIYKKRNDNASAIKMYQAAMEQDKQNLDLLVKLAEAQAGAGDTRGAIISYEQIVVLNPNASKEYKVLGDLVTKSGKAKEGMDNYRKYLSKGVTDQEVAVKVGLYEYANKQYKEAIDYLAKITDTKLVTAEVLFALGDSYNRTGDCKLAITNFERLRATNPPPSTQANMLRPLAECYEKNGEKARAADAYNAFTLLPNVKDADAAYYGAFLREETDMPNAIKRYEASTKNFPKDYRSFMRLGLHYAKSDATLQQAVTNLRAASLLADTVSIIWKTLGEVQGKLKNTDGELAAYTKYLTLKSDDVAVCKRVGSIQIERKQYVAGVASLERVALAKPEDYEVCMMLAVGYTNTNRPKEAAAQYKRAKSLKPDEVSIRLSYIDVLEKVGDSDGVKEERKSLSELDRKIVSADRKNVEARQRLVAYSIANKDNPRAYVLLKELAELTPKDADVFKRLFDIAMAEGGNKKEASDHLKKFIALKPNTADAQKSLGLLLYEEKDFDGALTAFREARRLDPAVKDIYRQYMTILIQKKLDNDIITVGVAAIAAKEADAAIYKAMGDIYAKQGKHADAAKMYKGALDLDTKNVTLLSLYAECLAKSGDARNAAISYEQVIMMNPNATKELKELGAIQARIGNQDQAMANYKRYLEKNPADEEVALAVGNFEHGKKNFQDAIKFYEMVKKADLQTLQYLIRLADCYYQTESFKKSAEIYARVWKSKNVTPAISRDILKPLAISYEKDSQLARAAEAYAAYVKLQGVVDQEASYKSAFLVESSNQEMAIKGYAANIKQFPKDARNYVRLGMIYAQKKDTHAEAATNLNAAVKLVENDADIWLQLAQVNGKLKRTDGELAAYRKYATLNPKDMSVSRRVGEIQYEKKQWSDAITNLELFLTTNDRDVKVLLMLVDAYEATNRQQKATEYLARAKNLNENDPGVRERLYLMYKKEGQKAKAESEIRDLVGITKNNKHRLMLVGDLIETGKFDEAAAVANEVRKSDPLNFDGLMAVATIQLHQRRYAECIETYKMVLMANDSYAPAYVGRGDAHLALNELDRAESFYKRALEFDSKSVNAELGLSRVYKAQKKKDLQTAHLNKARAIDPNNKAVQEELKLLGGSSGGSGSSGGGNKPSGGR